MPPSSSTMNRGETLIVSDELVNLPTGSTAHRDAALSKPATTTPPAAPARRAVEPLDLRDKAHPSEELPVAVGKTRAWWKRYDMDAVSTAYAKYAGETLRQRVLRDGAGDLTTGLGKLPDALKDCGLKRAFHDELGVRKVVFVFCDDLLTQAFRLPAWYSWKEELDRVFRAAGVDPRRVVRCLLAELGPGVDIPVHHDTGYWATRSHRVHVPILTDKAVTFFTGPKETMLEPVPFPEFSVIELNNRAKHAVTNKWTHPRVHLIFDWVEEHEPSIAFRDLDPELHVVTQTRRTITIVPAGSPPPAAATPAPTEEDLGLKTTDEDRKRITKELLASIREKHEKADSALAARFLREFALLTQRYGQGEILVKEYVAFMARCFGSAAYRQSCTLVAQALHDRERAAALVKAANNHEADGVLDHEKVYPLETNARFVVAGAMKCGTTSLFEYVNEHPLCVRPKQKEPHAFDWVWFKMCDAYAKQPSLAAKYANVFNVEALRAKPGGFSGEATPSYMFGGVEVARRLRAAAPGARLLVILRCPVARAVSHYRMVSSQNYTDEDQARRRGNVQGKTFTQCVEEDLAALERANVRAETTLASEFETAYLSDRPVGHGAHSYCGRGLYALQLELLLRVFPREQLMMLTLEELSKNKQETMNRVFRFLNVEPHSPPEVEVTVKRHNAADGPVPPDAKEMEKKLADFYRPHNARLKAAFPELDISSWAQ